MIYVYLCYMLLSFNSQHLNDFAGPIFHQLLETIATIAGRQPRQVWPSRTLQGPAATPRGSSGVGRRGGILCCGMKHVYLPEIESISVSMTLPKCGV